MTKETKAIDRRSAMRLIFGGGAAAVATAGVIPKAIAQFGGGPGGYYEKPYVRSVSKPADFVHKTLASSSKEDVGMRLVCQFDVSGSIDNNEYQIQLEAMANAIASDDFKNALRYRGGPQSIAICVTDFGSDADLAVPWVDIRPGEWHKLKALAAEIRKVKRREFGGTDHVEGLKFSKIAIDNCPWGAEKNVVDVITDGEHNENELASTYRDRLAKAGITINALVTENDFPTVDGTVNKLETWVRENLITPENARRADGRYTQPGFVKVVAQESFENSAQSLTEYRNAMKLAFRRKLILEVSGLDLEVLRRKAALLSIPDSLRFGKN